MYQPSFNSVLVEIDDNDAEWGGENNENMLGKSYNKGKVVSFGDTVADSKYSADTLNELSPFLKKMVGKQIMWNEGTEAGTTFEYDGKLYGFIYWWDIRGIHE